MKVYYASKVIAVDTPPCKHWLAKREEVDDIWQISWDNFVTLLYDGLGSKEACTLY